MPASRRHFLSLVLILALLATLAYGGRWLWIAVHVGTGYAAKVTCSLALNSGQDAERIFQTYVAREIFPLGSLLHVSVTNAGADATALGFIRLRAVHRHGLGCTLLPDGARETPLPNGVNLLRQTFDPRSPWPVGDSDPPSTPAPEVTTAIARAFAEPDASRPTRLTTAVVVAHDGQLIAERYAPGYGPQTPMLSWSMAKSVLAAVVGIAVGDGRLALRQPAPVPEWVAPGDPRHAITLDQLLRMSSGLAFDEHYGAVNDVSRMLFTQPDMGAFAASSPLAAPPDTRWSYSSGTANIIARLLRDSFHGDLNGLVRYTTGRLFDPVGMTSAFFEPDASGTPIGSSFAFMTARDWARFGELHRRDGMWNGQRILPEGWVRYVTTPTPPAPLHEYGALWWLNAGAAGDPSRRMWPGLPPDAYAARGHNGQYVIVVPSAKLVVVRLGLSTGDESNDGAQQLVADLLHALG